MTIGSYTIDVDLIIKGITLTGMILGLLVVLIPVLPGLVIIWVAAARWAASPPIPADNILMGTRAHKEGAPWWSILIALAAAIAGNFLLPILGGVLAALLALFLVELARRRDAKKALTATQGMLVGCGWAVVIRVIIGLVMIGLWLIWAWA